MCIAVDCCACDHLKDGVLYTRSSCAEVMRRAALMEHKRLECALVRARQTKREFDLAPTAPSAGNSREMLQLHNGTVLVGCARELIWHSRPAILSSPSRFALPTMHATAVVFMLGLYAGCYCYLAWSLQQWAVWLASPFIVVWVAQQVVNCLCRICRTVVSALVVCEDAAAAEDLLGDGEVAEFCVAIAAAVGGRSFHNKDLVWASRLQDVRSVMKAKCMWRAMRGKCEWREMERNVLKWVHLVENVAASGDHDAAGFLARHVSPFVRVLACCSTCTRPEC